MRTRRRTRLAVPMLAAVLGLGMTACDDTVDGIQEDTENNINEIDEELDTEDNDES